MWTLTFKDKNDATITVEIEGGNGTLTGAAEPLMTRELETDDPFDPVRYQTGYINLVGTDGTDIRPQDTFDRPVTIKKNGIKRWAGYLAVEEWNSSMSENPSTCSLPLISSLAALRYRDFSAAYQMSTVGKVLYKALSASFTNVYFAVHDIDVFNYALSELAFLKKDDGNKKKYTGINADMPKRANTYTCYDVLSEICKSFGWQAREHYGDLWLTSLDTTTAYKIVRLSDLAANVTTARGSGNGKLSTVNPASMNQSRNYLSPKYQVRITAKRHLQDSELLSLSSVAQKLEWDRFSLFNDNLNYQYYVADLFKPNTSVIEYRHDFGQACGDDFIGQQRGSRSPSEMTYKGATFCRDAFVEHKVLVKNPPSRSFNLTMTELPSATIVATLKSETYNFDEIDGDLDFVISAQAISFDDELNDHPEKRTAELPNLEFYIQFGNMWYNGSTWGSTKTKLNYSPQQWIADAAYHDCTGMRMNMPTGTGAFLIQIVAPYGIDQDKNPLKYVRISDISLTYKEKRFVHNNVEEEEERFNDMCDANGRDSYVVEHNLFFNGKVSTLNYPALLVYSHNAIIYPMVDFTSPLEPLLARMKEWYGKSHYKLQVDAIGSDFGPSDTASYNSFNCIIGARQINWRDAQTRLTLYSR